MDFRVASLRHVIRLHRLGEPLPEFPGRAGELERPEVSRLVLPREEVGDLGHGVVHRLEAVERLVPRSHAEDVGGVA